MKQYLNKGSLILLMTICIAVACKKSVDQPLLENNNNNNTSTTGNIPHPVDTTLSTPVAPVVPYPEAPASGCDFAPDYGDSIVFLAARVRGLLCLSPE